MLTVLCSYPCGQVEEIDLNALASIDGASIEDVPSIDAATCSLGLFMLRAEQQGKCLQGIHALLAPRGHLVATVWDSMPLMDIGGRVLAKVLGRDPEDTPPMPFSPTSLGNGSADALLFASGFELAARHNETHKLRLPQMLDWVATKQMRQEGGFCGRSNKLVDGCYSFWQALGSQAPQRSNTEVRVSR